ncbi:MAG: serine/threonine-protein phosphatase [Gammaproteobacteria bacterium]|nr:serine/threonine-protein phosphatase [Gammaproteobacteria bacterium]
MPASPPPRRHLRLALRSDRGRVRADNQDAVAADAAAGALVLADGVGGGPAGAVASRIVVDSVLNRLRPPPAADSAAAAEARLRQALEQANADVLLAAADPRRDGMASTVVAALVHPQGLSLAWAGDSRAYLIVDATARRLTEDHSAVAGSADRSRRGPLLRALGIRGPLRFDLVSLPLPAGATLLLCSDGLTDLLDDALIGLTVHACGADLDAAAEQLVAVANAGGGRDNISVILAA